MASETPDPRTFQTWEDAFQYPIPIVRKLEQQLRNNADDNREKLRSLVGYDATTYMVMAWMADGNTGRAIAVSSTRPERSSTWKCVWSRWRVGFQE
jgi:hypothetical protein